MATHFRSVRRFCVIAIVWYMVGIIVCAQSALNLARCESVIFLSWLFISISSCIAFSISKDVKRYVTMLVGAVAALILFIPGIGYVSALSHGGGVFLAFLVATQGALVGAIVLALARWVGRHRHHRLE